MGDSDGHIRCGSMILAIVMISWLHFVTMSFALARKGVNGMVTNPYGCYVKSHPNVHYGETFPLSVVVYEYDP